MLFHENNTFQMRGYLWGRINVLFFQAYIDLDKRELKLYWKERGRADEKERLQISKKAHHRIIFSCYCFIKARQEIYLYSLYKRRAFLLEHGDIMLTRIPVFFTTNRHIYKGWYSIWISAWYWVCNYIDKNAYYAI